MAEKNSIWGAVKGAFIETTPDPPKTTPAPPPYTPPVTGAPSIGGHPWTTSVVATPVVAVVDPGALEKLEGKLKEATPPVYAAFLQQYDALREVIPDEGVLFKAALKASKASVTDLATALDSLILLMGSTLSTFQKRVDDSIAQNKALAQQQLDAKVKLIQDGEAQIKALQDQITTLRADVASGQQQAQVEETRLTTVRQGFQAAYEQVVTRLNAQKQRLTMQKV